MLARKLVEERGASLIGRTVWTYEYGDWPGGSAVVVDLHPDPCAPDIVFGVRGQGFDYMGVLEHEEVHLQREDVIK